MPATSPLRQYVALQRTYDREMAAILLDAAKDAERIIKELALDKGVGAAVRRAQLQQASRELRSLSASLWGDRITPSVKRGMTEAAVQAANSETFVNDVLRKRLGRSIPELERAYAFDARTSMDSLYARAADGKPLSRNVYRSKAFADGLVDKEIRRALALQSSAAELAKRVSSLINPNTPGGVSYAANRLGRTEINNAFHTSQINRRKSEPWTTGMRWHLSGSHPRPDECNAYASGSHFRGGDAGVFKASEVPGKPHPNCLCYLTTETIGEQEFLDNFLGGKYDGYIESQTGLNVAS